MDEVFPDQSLFVDLANWFMRQRGADGLKDTKVPFTHALQP